MLFYSVLPYVVSAALSAVAATLMSSQILSIDPLAGAGLELDVMAAVVIGGASLYGQGERKSDAPPGNIQLIETGQFVAPRRMLENSPVHRGVQSRNLRLGLEIIGAIFPHRSRQKLGDREPMGSLSDLDTRRHRAGLPRRNKW